jgi:ABC-2 type transport system ATP-binding protein
MNSRQADRAPSVAGSRVAVSARALTRRYGDVTAVDGVRFDLEPDTIIGLLGRNGAGKSTVLRLITGQARASAGEITVFGESPFENDRVLRRVCFVGESQVYPDSFRVRDVWAAGRLAYPRWDDEFAMDLMDAFSLPVDRPVRKLSRGMRSSVGIVLALASRAPVTLLDEPYLGLDAVARQIFYDRLLADFAEHPRTVVLSTHLIDEVSDLLQRVVLIDHGQILLDEDAEALRGSAVLVCGATPAVTAFAAGRDALRIRTLASFTRATLRGVDAGSRDLARRSGLTVEALSLQDLVVDLTLQEPVTSAGDSTEGPAAHQNSTLLKESR